MRQIGVVGKFVEFFGPGVSELSLADRATISNMCPEYGATVGYFPPDQATISYLTQTGNQSPPLLLCFTELFYLLCHSNCKFCDKKLICCNSFIKFNNRISNPMLAVCSFIEIMVAIHWLIVHIEFLLYLRSIEESNTELKLSI